MIWGTPILGNFHIRFSWSKNISRLGWFNLSAWWTGLVVSSTPSSKILVVKFTVNRFDQRKRFLIIDGTSLYTPALYGVFLIWGIHPVIIHFSRIFHYKPSLVGGLEHFFFSHSVGNVIIPTFIFFRGLETTKQIYIFLGVAPFQETPTSPPFRKWCVLVTPWSSSHALAVDLSWCFWWRIPWIATGSMGWTEGAY